MEVKLTSEEEEALIEALEEGYRVLLEYWSRRADLNR